MNTLVLAPFSDTGLARLRETGIVAYEPWMKTQRIYDPEELGERLTREGWQALVVEADFLFEELFAAAQPLRFAAISRGALNQVDLEAATERGIVVVHTPGRNAQAVAELVLGHLLGLARHIPQSSRFVEDGRWQDPTEAYTRFQGREIAGATLGVIGLGEIGRRVARLGRGVGMRLLAHDPFITAGSQASAGNLLVPLDELLSVSDFVSVHVPETYSTIGMLDARRLALMRESAYLVNVTSPAVVDQRALAEALRSGRLAGAAMDVHDSHPLAPDSPLIGLPNVVLTPHIGGATVETVERHSGMVVGDLQRYVAGRRPTHLANPAVWRKRRRP